MAEVLGKSNLFTACNYSQKKNQEGGVPLFSRRISAFCLRKNSFPTLRLEPQALRSGFNGQRVVFLEKRGLNERRFCRVPIKAQTKKKINSPVVGRRGTKNQRLLRSGEEEQRTSTNRGTKNQRQQRNKEPASRGTPTPAENQQRTKFGGKKVAVGTPAPAEKNQPYFFLKCVRLKM
ncbi:hypothetical protein Goshw_024816 [Gossypium schwendimanii]|uniref:Uncharacterized protein n=1 Tax=Gossypium schwendimanii TaxID=34291 RepID=A0A7J9N3W4_GOSSC|nr:hypothetical protein [Gossypium schwendimanii]